VTGVFIDIELNTRKCVNVNIGLGRCVALCEHSPHYGARLPRQTFITSASVPSSPLRRPLFLPSQHVHTLRHSIPLPPVLRYLVNLLHLLSSAAMHDSPSSPRRSIAPAPSKQQQTKKAGAPKAKGAVRAKSGCYTCRIRRKVGHLRPPLHIYIYVLTLGRVPSPQKCDERPNAEGRCETCIRLRLQCLGFGQKRPEWLKVCVPCVRRAWVTRRPFPGDLTTLHRKTIM